MLMTGGIKIISAAEKNYLIRMIMIFSVLMFLHIIRIAIIIKSIKTTIYQVERYMTFLPEITSLLLVA